MYKYLGIAGAVLVSLSAAGWGAASLAQQDPPPLRRSRRQGRRKDRRDRPRHQERPVRRRGHGPRRTEPNG